MEPKHAFVAKTCAILHKPYHIRSRTRFDVKTQPFLQFHGEVSMLLIEGRLVSLQFRSILTADKQHSQEGNFVLRESHHVIGKNLLSCF